MRRVVLSLLCLLSLAAAWFFWPSSSRPVAPAQPAAAAAAPQTPTAKSAVAPVASVTTNALVTRSAASTNRESFRLSNTTRTLGELTLAPHAILLENALVDTDAKRALTIPKHLQASGEPGAFIVQAHGPVDAAFRATLAAAGGQIISYIPNNAYLVQLSGAGAGVLAADPLVQAVLPYAPYFKVQATLLGLAVEQKPLPPGKVLTIGLFAAGADSTLSQIRKMGGQIIATDRSPFGPVVRVLPAAADWLALAQLPGVQRVEPATRRQLANDLSRVTMGISTDTVTNANWLGLSGSNVVVEVNDTGIDAGHPDFSVTGSAGSPGANPPSRVTGEFASSLVDVDGHGTHVGGIIAGNGSESYSLTNAARGSVTNADFRGKAPAARLFSFGFLGANDTNVFVSDEVLQSIPALTNALISNNSWVNGGAYEYDLSAASYDAAVRDALPYETGPQPVLFVFAAGNVGGGEDYGSGGSSDTILSPGTAKNVITVGALEQYRNITNEVVLLDGTTNTPWAGGTDSANEVAPYSSRGNVGVQTEGTYGRFKPDVVAPGSFVVSTRPVAPMWDMAAYYNPTNYHDEYSQAGVTVTPTQLVYGGAPVPNNAVGVNIKVVPNRNSPTPFPTNFPIYFSQFGVPSATNNDFATSNNVLSIPPGGGSITSITPLLNSGFSCSVGDPTNFNINFDLIIQVVTTNDGGNTLTVLSNLNETVGPFYYYSSGTSMAAPGVSGALALMQDFFTNVLHSTPSPALLKGMLINGSRLTSGYNNFAVTNDINYEGWGLVNVPNSIPLGLTNTATGASNTVPMFFLDQSPTNVLATGDSRSYSVTVPTPQARNQIMRITLAWTDPPGNPAAGIKLVNNLDLIVTNLANGAVYYGNQFVPGTTPISVVADSNSVPDAINNVESIWLPAPLGTNYSVTVLGRNVTVNAVTAEQTNIVQDYALVISCGDAANTNGIVVASTTPAPVPSTTPVVTFVQSYTNGIYFNQIAGANAPWLSTNASTIGTNYGFGTNADFYIGQTNQWHFFIVTNTTSFTNAAFIIFLPATKATPRMGVYENSTDNSTRPEADLNLLVASAPDANALQLTNLNYAVISNCVYGVNGDQSALARGGTKFVAYNNSVNGQVYVVGVQCTDQMGGEFGFLPIFSQNPFSTLNPDGSQTVNGLLLPAAIPDGNNAHAGVAYVFGLALYPMNVGTVTVTNTISHENFGDLVGALTHGSDFAVLNNHNGEPSAPVINYTQVYNDAGQPGTVGTAGPGSLKNFQGAEAIGPWLLTEVDDATGHTGSITGFTLNIKPNPDLTKQPYTTVSILPGTWFIGFVDVPAGYTNITVIATNLPPTSTPPIQLYLNYNQEPTFSNYLGFVLLTNGAPPGNSISYGPPMLPGRYFVGLFNPDIITHDVLVGVKLGFSASAISTVNYSGTGPVTLKDDAVNYDYTFVTNKDLIQGINIGLRVDHPRISDLTFTLISPDDTRYLLMENRGGQSTNGCGITVVTTNIVNVSANGGAQANTNYIDIGLTSGTFPITYNFYTAPDQMTVYYGTNIVPANLILDTGLTNNPSSGAGGPQGTLPITVTVSFPPPGVPATSTYLTIVMNQFGNPNPQTAWTYTAGGVLTNTYYLTLTENTNLTTTPIKYAVPPFTPVVTTSASFQTNIFGYVQWPSSIGGNDHWYKAVTNSTTSPLTWDQAEQIAHGEGGYLATITSAAENDFVFSLINDPQFFKGIGGNGSGPAIGGIQTNGAAEPAGGWTWETGETWAYTSWNTSQPDNGFGFINENRLQYWSGSQGVPTSKWNDLPSGDSNLGGYVIERESSTNVINSADNLYYQPEQSLENLVGTSAYGEWQLEILDNRAGATNNTTLQSWQLQFTFANTNYTIPTITITNGGGPITNYIPGGGLQWYLIDVPTNADIATNSLLFATLPLNMWWSTNVPPTITNVPVDVSLLTNVLSGAAILGTNGSPINTSPAFITPGGTYYLGIQNPNLTGATYAIDVTFHYVAGIPLVITLPATNVTFTTATLNGSVNPNSLAAAAYFEYGTTTNYGLVSTSLLLTNNLGSYQNVAIGVTNLSPGVTYHFRAVATNALGTNYGLDLTFFTALAANAYTAPATLANGSSAQLNGFASPNGSPSTAWFEWGASQTYGLTTPPVNVGSNFNVVFVTNQITGLTTNLPYHFRLVVSNVVGVAYGFDHIFDQANVAAWGANYFGQTTVPTGLTNLVYGIGAGYDTSLALNYDGSVVAWGDNTFGQTNVPVGLNNAVAVDGGDKHSVVLRSDRTVLVWGSNQFGQTNAPANLTNAVGMSSGSGHVLALRDDGLVAAWGFNSSGQRTVPTGLSNVVAVAAGELHSLALKNDGTVAAWGYNGDGATDVPTNLTDVVAIAAGYHSMALKRDGTVVAWGYDGNGQVSGIPPGLTNVIAIAAGSFHSLALRADGTIVGWGDNSSGQLYPLTAISNVVAIAAGGLHSLALSSLFGLNQTNYPPFWTNGLNGTTLTMNEMTNLVVNNHASDTNKPAQILTYQLATNAPAWASIDFVTGLITFTPGEVDGPGSYVITTIVRDNGYPPLSATNSFTLTVNEVNRAPFWPTNVPSQTNYLVAQFHSLTVTNTAADLDIPTNALTYKLSVSPVVSNAVISANGIITWTPLTNGTFTLTTIVTDTNPPAVNTKSLTATNTFTVTVIPPVSLTNGTPFTNTVLSGDVAYYRVNVPTNADFATNLLLSATPAGLNLWFTTNPPLGNLGEVLLLTNATSGSAVMNTNTAPLLVPGSFYWLAVQNTNAVPVTYGLEVDFHLVTTTPIVPVNIASIIYTNIGGTNGFLLTWYAPSNDLFEVQFTDTLVPATWITFTNPLITSYNTNFPASATNAQFNFFDDGSQAPFGPTRFYRLILLQVANTLTFPTPSNLTTTAGSTVTVTNAATDSNPAAVVTYSLVSSPAGATINSTNGIITWTNANPPGLAARFTTLAVDNGSPAASATNTFTVFVLPVPAITNIAVTATNVTLSWLAPTNDSFQVQWTTNLAPPVWLPFPGTITSTNGVFSFVDTNAPLLMKFYQLILLP